MSGSHPLVTDTPLLSICIATYNRSGLVVPAVREMLLSPGNFEIRLHDDGSTDGTLEMLSGVGDARLHVSHGPNLGRAGALKRALAQAQGKFSMFFDDDDVLHAEGLREILSDCSRPLPEGVVGYIYHLARNDSSRLGSIFPVARSNFLELRSDLGVWGDKKEVVRTALLQDVVDNRQFTSRRVPTSLYWSMLALSGDVLCRNVVIGEKHYHAGGMSHRISRLKWRNPQPMAELYRQHLRGFCRRRYRSIGAAGRALAGFLWYSGLSLVSSARALPRDSRTR